MAARDLAEQYGLAGARRGDDQAALTLADRRHQVDHLRGILPLTQENLELTTQAFKAGQAGFDFLRVRDAEDTYLRTRTSYIDALTTLRKVAVEIAGLELTGGLNPTEIGTALQATPGVPAGLGGVLLQFSQQEAGGAGRTLPGAIQSTVTGRARRYRWGVPRPGTWTKAIWRCQSRTAAAAMATWRPSLSQAGIETNAIAWSKIQPHLSALSKG